jgi:hypothetical protein
LHPAISSSLPAAPNKSQLRVGLLMLRTKSSCN